MENSDKVRYWRKQRQYLRPEYKAWTAMHQRCKNPKCAGFEHYGGRGIKVCERWNYSIAFLVDMGPRPSPKHSLDRIDNDGDYTPENCRWSLIAEQLRNTRRNKRITFRGETRCLADWAQLYGLDPNTLHARLTVYGWTVEEALTTPPQKGKRPDRLREEAGTLITFGGKSLSIPEWANHLGISEPAMHFRLQRWPIERALSEKRSTRGPRPSR